MRRSIVFGEKLEHYCGNCGHRLDGKTVNCPHCGAPLSITLVTVSEREREWINPDKWVIGRKGWIQAQFLKRWLPKYEEWLYNTKHKSLGELSSDEIRQTEEEYKKFLEERRKEMENWTVTKPEMHPRSMDFQLTCSEVSFLPYCPFCNERIRIELTHINYKDGSVGHKVSVAQKGEEE
jgi:sarcosine oxidase delta subunit